MKFRWKNLLLWFTAFYFLVDPIRRTLFYGKKLAFEDLSSTKAIWLTATGFLIFFLYTLGSYSAFYKFFVEKKWHWLALALIAALTLPIALRYGIEEIIFPNTLGFDNYFDSMSLKNYVSDNFFYSFRFGLVGAIYFFIQRLFHKQKVETKLELENKELHLAHLRSQLNPHFLLNSLNNIYSLVYHKSDGALPALNHLSEILKYGLYEEKKFVSLERELTFVKEYINLHQIRVSGPIKFNQSIDFHLLTKQIPHFLLIPLVENIFNHGDLTRPLALKIDSTGKDMVISLSNSVSNARIKETGGIGLENTKKRLNLLYDSNAVVTTQQKDNLFNVKLSIPLDA